MLRKILRAAALCSACVLSACGNGSGLVQNIATQSAATQQSDASITLGAGDVQSMCVAVILNAHHCLGYSLTLSGLKRAQDTTLGKRRGYGSGGNLRKFGTDLIGSALPEGYGPSDLQTAYNLSVSSSGSGRVVAVVESGDAPTLNADLSVYRSTYGLSACTIANGCLRKIAQDGSANLPAYDPNWAGETQLDVDMVSALCPACHILVVEASNESSGLDIAENAAAQAGAFAISNSWGGVENASEASYFQHPGIVITASTGDGGYAGGVQSPSNFSTVIAVSGTTLLPAGNARGWSETAWSGSGGGCSAIVAKPSWQKDAGCSMRTIADIAFDADPASGVAVYDGNPQDAVNVPLGWRVGGGTSIGAPAIAALFAAAGISASDASQIYANESLLNDIVSGSTGTCSTSYLCNAQIGYDGPTGNGTPNGLGGL